MQELIKSIHNREILIEVLHHAIDYLIGNRTDNNTIRMSHKFGYQNPDDFLHTIKTIAQYYRKCCLDSTSTLSCNALPNGRELQVVSTVLLLRQPEMMAYMCRQLRRPLLECFFWDTRMVLGDSSYNKNIRFIATLTLHSRQLNHKRLTCVVEMDSNKLTKLIHILDAAVQDAQNSLNI